MIIEGEKITKFERMIMGIHAHIVEDRQFRMNVVAHTPKGKWISLGWVDMRLYYADHKTATKAINKIMFGEQYG